MTGTTCFDERYARSATSLEEAERCLLGFIREGVCSDERHHIREHSFDSDLHLPWFMEVVEYAEPYADAEPLPIPSLAMLYMDAAWSLVMKGTLRPGPRSVSGEANGSAFGKSFSLFHREKP